MMMMMMMMIAITIITILTTTTTTTTTTAALINRKSVAKDRYLIELREGSKILEDQLRLMDEKYLELRGKLVLVL